MRNEEWNTRSLLTLRRRAIKPKPSGRNRQLLPPPWSGRGRAGSDSSNLYPRSRNRYAV